MVVEAGTDTSRSAQSQSRRLRLLFTAAGTPRVNPASGYRCTSFKALKIDYRDGVLIKNAWIPVLEIPPQFLPSLKSLVHRILVC